MMPCFKRTGAACDRLANEPVSRERCQASHLRVLVIVVLDKSFIAHPWFLLDENGRLDNLPKAGRSFVACFQDHLDFRWSVEKTFR